MPCPPRTGPPQLACPPRPTRGTTAPGSTSSSRASSHPAARRLTSMPAPATRFGVPCSSCANAGQTIELFTGPRDVRVLGARYRSRPGKSRVRWVSACLSTDARGEDGSDRRLAGRAVMSRLHSGHMTSSVLITDRDLGGDATRAPMRPSCVRPGRVRLRSSEIECRCCLGSSCRVARRRGRAGPASQCSVRGPAGRVPGR